MPVAKFTEAEVDKFPLGSGIWRDTEVKGLLCICHRSCRTFAVQGDVRRNGRHIRTVRVVIDRADRITVREARVRAKALMSQIQSGVDPTAKAPETGITLAQALARHIDENKLRPRTVEGYTYHVDHYLKAWRNRAMADISRQDVRDRYGELRTRNGDTTAASVMRTLKALYTTARRHDETLGECPVACLKLPSPNKRQVAPIDLRDWWERVQALPPVRRDWHIAALLTGARRSTLLHIRRDDVDTFGGALTFRWLKTQDDPMLFPMGFRLAMILGARLKEDEPLNSEWLWPANSSSGHLMEPRAAGLPGPHE